MLQFYDQAGVWDAGFVCDENDQRLFLPNIKLNREALATYAYSSFSRLLIVFLATGTDILNTTYHVNLL